MLGQTRACAEGGGGVYSCVAQVRITNNMLFQVGGDVNAVRQNVTRNPWGDRCARQSLRKGDTLILQALRSPSRYLESMKMPTGRLAEQEGTVQQDGGLSKLPLAILATKLIEWNHKNPQCGIE